MENYFIKKFLIILLILNGSLIFANEEIPDIDVKVNYLGDAQAYYITQAIWLPDIPDSLITIYFNSDNKTFFRYIINVYNPVNDVYTTLFEEQENKNFYIKLFFYNKGILAFLKKFTDNPFDTKDYVVYYDMNKKIRTVKLLKDEKNKIMYDKNMLGKEIQGKLTDYSKAGYLKLINNNLFLINEQKGKTIKEELLLTNVSTASIISGTKFIVFQRNWEYFIYDIILKKVLYKLNFIESYSRFKVDVVNLLDFDPKLKYILFETKGNYNGRNKKSVGTLIKKFSIKNFK